MSPWDWVRDVFEGFRMRPALMPRWEAMTRLITALRPLVEPLGVLPDADHCTLRLEVQRGVVGHVGVDAEEDGFTVYRASAGTSTVSRKVFTEGEAVEVAIAFLEALRNDDRAAQ